MKNLRVTVNGTAYDVQVEELETSQDTSKLKQESTLNEENNKNNLSNKKSSNKNKEDIVTSPMPGTVVTIKVKNGDEVKAGQTLLLLEAMKMENEIVSPKDGVIDDIIVTKGQNVESGESLIYLK